MLYSRVNKLDIFAATNLLSIISMLKSIIGITY
jgi:hypothetical protein